jgi:hypothetical protein
MLGSVLVNMWNHTSFPAYKSRLWNMTGSSAGEGQEAEKRKGCVYIFSLSFSKYWMACTNDGD